MEKGAGESADVSKARMVSGVLAPVCEIIIL